MKRTFLRTLTFLVLGMGIATYAQQPGPSRQPDSPDAVQAQRISVTGCLAKGTEANQYMLTDSSSHEKYTFPGPSQLDRFLNQTVKMTGAMEAGDHGEKVFRPESIAPVSASCS